MVNRTVFVVLFSCISLFSFAQNDKPSSFKKLDVTVAVGSMGISAEASTNICDWGRIRGGVSWMPTINTVMGFDVQVGEDDKKYDENGNRIPTKFDKMSGLLEDVTGYKVDNVVNMDCKATYFNAKVMFDVMPFENKDWHFTAGFYLGTRKIGEACNSKKDMTTTLAVGMYNTIYDKIYNFEPIIGGSNGIPSVSLPPDYEEKVIEYGRMGMNVGIRKADGSVYMMEPDEDGTVKAWAKIKAFKPYIGFGWEHTMKCNPEWHYGFDAGVIFWGGVPNVYTHDGTSLTKDIKCMEGKVDKVVSFVKAFPVFPLLEIKISKEITFSSHRSR